MTAALTFNGITIPVLAKSFEETPDFIGDLADRGAAGDFDENFVARKRKWTAIVLAQPLAKATAMRRYLEGDGQSFLFDSNSFSFKGEGPGVGGTYTQSGAGGVLSGGKVNVGSGSFFPLALANSLNTPSGWTGAKGWSLIVRKVLTVGDGDGGDGATFKRFIATGAVTVLQGASANPAGVTQYLGGSAGNHSMGNWITVDGAGDGVVKLHGVSNANASAAYDYCDYAFLPFQLDSTWIAGLDTFLQSNRHSKLKRVVLSGAHLATDPSPGVEVHIRATTIKPVVRTASGVVDPTWRSLALQIWEK